MINVSISLNDQEVEALRRRGYYFNPNHPAPTETTAILNKVFVALPVPPFEPKVGDIVRYTTPEMNRNATYVSMWTYTYLGETEAYYVLRGSSDPGVRVEPTCYAKSLFKLVRP